MTFPSSGLNSPVPGSRLPAFHIQGLTVALDATTPDSLLVLSTGQCADHYDNIDMVVDAEITLNAGVVGVNGMDVGALGNNLFYYIHVIGDSSGFNKPAGLISLSYDAPALPYGYDSFRMVDIKVTDGTADFILSYTEGVYGCRKFIYDAPPIVLTATGQVLFVALDLSETVAPVGTPMVQFTASITPETAGNDVTLVPTGSTSTAYAILSGSVAAVAEVGDLDCIAFIDDSGNASIDYATSAAADTASLWVKSFTYYV